MYVPMHIHHHLSSKCGLNVSDSGRDGAFSREQEEVISCVVSCVKP